MRSYFVSIILTASEFKNRTITEFPLWCNGLKIQLWWLRLLQRHRFDPGPSTVGQSIQHCYSHGSYSVPGLGSFISCLDIKGKKNNDYRIIKEYIEAVYVNVLRQLLRNRKTEGIIFMKFTKWFTHFNIYHVIILY